MRAVSEARKTTTGDIGRVDPRHAKRGLERKDLFGGFLV
jgi:hypothetical protein